MNPVNVNLADAKKSHSNQEIFSSFFNESIYQIHSQTKIKTHEDKKLALKN